MGIGDEGRSTAHAILLVDDDPDQGEALATLLETRGYAVTVAASGTEALAVLAAGLRPCLLVLDLGLPDMHGLEFMRQHRRDPAGLPPIPVILYSAFTDVAFHARESGAVAGVTKPNLDRLFHFVALVLKPTTRPRRAAMGWQSARGRARLACRANTASLRFGHARGAFAAAVMGADASPIFSPAHRLRTPAD